MLYFMYCGLTLMYLFSIVIGRGGEMINKLQSESGAKIQVATGKKLLMSYSLRNCKIANCLLSIGVNTPCKKSFCCISFSLDLVETELFLFLKYFFPYFLYIVSFLDLPQRSYKLTVVRPSVRLLPAFLEIGSLVFSDFWHKDAKWQSTKCDKARVPEKIFFWLKIPEIYRKTGFLAFSRDSFISFF